MSPPPPCVFVEKPLSAPAPSAPAFASSGNVFDRLQAATLNVAAVSKINKELFIRVILGGQ